MEFYASLLGKKHVLSLGMPPFTDSKYMRKTGLVGKTWPFKDCTYPAGKVVKVIKNLGIFFFKIYVMYLKAKLKVR